MKPIIPALLATLSIAHLLPFAHSAENLPIESVFAQTPASKWEDAMVSGNGLTGVMQHGDPANEQYTFTSHRFVKPNGAPYDIPDMSDMLEPMRDLMLSGEIGKGWETYHLELLKRQGFDIENLEGNYAGMLWSQSFHPGYILKQDAEPVGEIRNYIRYTDYQSGEIVVKWEDDLGPWERRTFVSRPDNVIVTRTIAPQGTRIACRLSAAPSPKHPEDIDYQVLTNKRFINFRATYAQVEGRSKRGGYEGVTRVVAVGGKTQVDGDALQVKGATELILLTQLDRDRYDHQFWEDQRLQASLNQIEADYDTLAARHIPIHQDLFNRVKFTLGAPFESISSKDLLAREEADTATVDTLLVEKLFYTSRYLFISSCGSQYGPRLSGLFIGAWGAAWAGDYTCDANVNLAVMGGGIGDLPECMEGYFQTIERSLPQWRQAARQFYGCRGIIGPVRIDGEVGVPLHVSAYHAHTTATGLGPWLLYPFFEHYLITNDRKFAAERLYPLLFEQAIFYEDFLSRADQNGHYIFVPSNSPENAWEGVAPRTSASINATMDIAACKHSLKMLMRLESDLGIAKNEKRWQALLAKMPPYLVNDDGALQEWSWEGHGENYGHRHSSHMYTVWPAYEINPDDPSAASLIPAVSKALDMRKAPILHAHDALMKSIARIRIKEGENLYENLKFLLEKKYFYESLASSHDLDHHIYNYDLVLTLQGLLVEMALYTDSQTIELLPALPKAFPQGKIQGIKGRNAVSIEELQWDLPKGTLHCKLVSSRDQTLTLIHRGGISAIDSTSPTKPSPIGNHARQLTLPKNQPVEITIDI